MEKFYLGQVKGRTGDYEMEWSILLQLKEDVDPYRALEDIAKNWYGTNDECWPDAVVEEDGEYLYDGGEAVTYAGAIEEVSALTVSGLPKFFKEAIFTRTNDQLEAVQ